MDNFLIELAKNGASRSSLYMSYYIGVKSILRNITNCDELNMLAQIKQYTLNLELAFLHLDLESSFSERK